MLLEQDGADYLLFFGVNYFGAVERTNDKIRDIPATIAVTEIQLRQMMFKET